jgi:hypothetical protein
MNAKEALKEIRVMLGMEPKAEATSIELAEATLVDGTVVKVEGELEEGKSLVVVTEEGDVPAPEGVHETSDGKLITVDASGVIISIEDKPEEEAVEQEMEAEEAAPEEAAPAAAFGEELLAEIAGLISPLSERLNAIEAKFSALDTDFHQFRDQPAAERITNNLQLSTQDINSHSARQEQRMKTLLELKKNK